MVIPRMQLLGMVVVLAAAVPAGGGRPGGSGGAVVLNEQAYIRQYLVFGLERLAARPLREEADKFFPKPKRGRSDLFKLQRITRKLLAGRGIDWSKTDWRDVAVYHWSRTQCGVDERGAMMLPTIWPPADWAEVGFDDSGWLSRRLGRLTPQRLGASAYDMNSLLYRAAYYRTCFLVPDPAKAKDLTVRIRYRGGARILINGKEIARGHLPPGKLDEQTHAPDYPHEAYVATDDEIRPDLSNNQKYNCAQGIADLRTDWDEARIVSRKGQEVFRVTCMEQSLNKKGWQRIQNLRDRSLGPVTIPPRLLRKGINVLAVETRTSFYHAWIIPTRRQRRWSAHGGCTNLSWDHCGLVRIEMRSASSSAPSMLRRPAGVGVWVSDMHNRLWSPDYKPLRGGGEVLRFVGARNGTFSGQLGVSTNRELTGLKASCSDLAGAGGAKIPAGAVRIMPMQGQPVWKLNYLGQGRSERVGYRPRSPRLGASTGVLAVHRYRVLDPLPRGRGGRIEEKVLAGAYEGLRFFDHISASWPAKVPADSCQGLWVYLKVPAAAAEGVYTGAVTVRADGVRPVTVPVRAEVIGWRVPDTRQFQTFVQSEQSPYGVARQYKVPLWSEEHFRLMASSFRQLARLGVSWVYVPVLIRSELGNRDDMMIRWIRRADGTLGFDYSIMDRYLALAVKHLGRPKVVCFVVMHGSFSSTNAVKVIDAATGRPELLDVGPARGAARKPLWRAFATDLYDHMKALGLERSMYWGQAFDDVPDKPLVTILAEATPSVYWACAGHGRGPDATFRAASRAYGVDLGDSSLRGWKNPFIHLLMPRGFGSVICVEGTSTPFTHRVLVDRAIYTGFNGIGRMGADYFLGTWLNGYSSAQWNLVGRSCVQTLWPGKHGAEASARHEAMLEGVQETEARIYLEQVLERGVLPAALADKVQKVLDRHCHETLYVPGGAASVYLMDYTSDWQGRSRRLYGAAAEVARKIGMDVDRTAFGRTSLRLWGRQRFREVVSVPALGRNRLSLKLRNWSDSPRAWKAAASEPWIIPEKPRGNVIGQQELGIILDGKTLQAGAKVTGTLTVTDVPAGTVYPVKITAKVEKGVELELRRELQFVTGGGSGSEQPKLVRVALEPVLNAPVGGSDGKEYVLVNRTAARQPWRIASDRPWLAAEPPSGQIAPNASIRVKLIARPPDKAGAVHEPTLTLTAAGGAVREQYRIKTYVIPPYRRPALPPGQAVYLNDLDQKKFMKRHVDAGFSKDTKGPRPWIFAEVPVPYYHRFHRAEKSPQGLRRENYATAPYTMGGKTYRRGLWASPGHETVYEIEGAGFTAFAADVGFYEKLANSRYANLGAVVSFEVYVDGRLRAQSGLMRFGEKPRLLVADRLEGARRVKLVTRRDDLVDDWYCVATWADPRFLKAK